MYGNKIIDVIGSLYSKIIMRNILNMVDGIQFMTHHMLIDSQALKIGFKKCFVCSHGVDIELFKPRNNRDNIRNIMGLNKNDIVILYVGRLDAVKGVDYLILAAKNILSLNKDVKILIVGDGTLRNCYENLAKPFDNIVFLGWQNNISDIMSIADIFVLPSVAEGAPNVLMEASASGLPVITTDVGESSQIVSNGETGIVIPSKDINKLANSMTSLIEDRALARKMGEAGRRRIEEYYSWDKICDKLENAYHDVIIGFNSELT